MDKVKDILYLTLLERALKRFSQAAGDDGFSLGLDSLIRPVESQYIKVIEKAETLSLGDMEYPRNGYQISHTNLMECLLEKIKDEKRDSHAEYFQPMMPLTLERTFFPSKASSPSHLDIASLWSLTKKNIESLNCEDIKMMSENILNVLFRFATTVPSSPNNIDVSLYDQTRVAAAIAVCLYDYGTIDNIDNAKSFRLIGGDFSGIQKYIYQIVSKYAGKNLKGRSFYLSLLSDAVVRNLLSELSLYSANIIYNSGGSFYILAPNTDYVKAKLKETVKDIGNKIFHSHGTQLYVAIDSVSISASEIANHSEERNLRQIWQELFRIRDDKKSCRYADSIEDDYDAFFSPQEIDGDKRDAITGEDFIKGEVAVGFGENGAYTSELNSEQIKLGKELKESDVIVVSSTPLDSLESKPHINPANIGFYYYLATIKDIEQKAHIFLNPENELTLIFLNGISYKADYVLDKGLTCNFCSMQFYGGNQFNGNTFEDMCDNEGFSRLGVLRMDVDNLGSIFQQGISENKSSLARYAALSRSFDYFFSGYLNSICLQKGFQDRSFVVYSGGDDVFIVGSWDTTIEIAQQIRTDFKLYTCGNPAFSISGGIAILGSKYPIIAGAEESAEEEERAKGHECKGLKKNSISFFSTPLNWDNEFPAVKSLKDNIVNLLYSGQLPKAFLSTIIEQSLNAKFDGNHKPRNYKVYWQLTYGLKRMKERYNTESAQAFLEGCVSEICHANGSLNGNAINTDYNSLELWAFACRWAEFEYRTNNN